MHTQLSKKELKQTLGVFVVALLKPVAEISPSDRKKWFEWKLGVMTKEFDKAMLGTANKIQLLATKYSKDKKTRNNKKKHNKTLSSGSSS